MSEVITLLESTMRDMENNVLNLTKDGKCTQCGECCGDWLPLSDKEIREIHRYVKKKHIKECRHLVVSTAEIDGLCPFLDTSKSCEKCRIYPVRPMVCKKFICDSKQRVYFSDALANSRKPISMREEFFGEEK